MTSSNPVYHPLLMGAGVPTWSVAVCGASGERQHWSRQHGHKSQLCTQLCDHNQVNFLDLCFFT